MATKRQTRTSAARQAAPRSNTENVRWVVGFLLFIIGVYLAISVIWSYFYWAADQSAMRISSLDREAMQITSGNFCGFNGAWIAMQLVDRSFGFFGVLIPVMILLIGVRIVRERPVLFNHSILSLFFILILGSLTLGLICGDSWSLCCSTGWGGIYGIEVGRYMLLHLGGFGCTAVLFVGWVLTGVFINRNFINTVNSAGNAMVDRAGKIVDIVKQKVTSTREGDYDIDDAAPAQSTDPIAPSNTSDPQPVESVGKSGLRRQIAEPETIISRPVADSSLQVAATAVATATAATASVPQNTTLPTRPTHQIPNDDPFVELGADGKPIIAIEPEPVSKIVAVDDGPFTEIDLSQSDGRVVMGRNGLVEVARPAAVVASTVASACLATTQNGPFTEIEIPIVENNLADGALAPQAQDCEIGESSNNDQFTLTESDIPFSIDNPTHLNPLESTDPIVVSVQSNVPRVVDPSQVDTSTYDPLKDLINYKRPPVNLLEDYQSDSQVSDEEIFYNKSRIQETLMDFGIPIQRIKATVGPTVTLYEIVQAQGVKISKIQGLENDIAQSLKALGIRIIAPIPGKGTIGIEVPNRDKQVVSMYSSILSQRFQESKAELPIVLGRTIQNENFVFDLTKMPHLLVAGATGQGKSVGLNAIITSLLYRKHPAQLKFVLIDPKMVEFSLYSRIERHFLAKMESEEEAVITDPKKAVYTLNALCVEMDTRLELCKKAGVRNIMEYNSKFTSRQLNPQNGHRFLPYIVVIVDEFADLIMTAREVEAPVMRLAQKARAVGIHLIIATQRPDVKVITGGIKANFPARIAFRVMQMIDSRTIIDQPGANQLIGRGDMLFSKDGELTRMQCALVETNEVERVVDYVSRQQGYTEAYNLPDYTPDAGSDSTSGLGSEDSAPVKYDALFAEIAREAVSAGSISTSMIQRNYEVGFNRAGRIMLQLERAGIVGRQHGVKPRDILFYDITSLEAKLQDMGL